MYTTASINTSATIVAPAGAEIANFIGKAFKFDAEGNAVVASTAGEKVIGIAVLTHADKIAKGEDVTIQVKEIGKAVAGAAIKKGAELAVAADGTLKEAADGQFVIATALQAANGAGHIIDVQISKYQK